METSVKKDCLSVADSHEHNHEHSYGHEHSHDHEHSHGHGAEHHSHENNHCCAHEHDHGHAHSHSNGHDHGCSCDCPETDVRKIIGGVVLFLAAMVVFHIPGLFKSVSDSTMDNIELITYLLIYLITAKDIVVSAIKNLTGGKALDEQFLMTVASLGAFFVGEYSEACAVMLFYLVGEAFQDYAVDRSKDSIAELMDIRPDYANIIRKDGTIEKFLRTR